ncbi:34515_t:CDS:2 [Racocetra persica]|uniref:34515_t:CDS:1 n=1 Tax=Racocetra persica TaxID=160502 RepID=A0ACA9PZ47_9GLOM|nr:34515_t:CDS:2 [Racocetra persica]
MGGGRIYVIKKSPYFGNVQVNKKEHDCLRIKVCQFTDPSFTSIEHNKVDVESSFTYLAAKDTSCKFKYDNGSTGSGKPILYQWHRYTKINSENVDIVLFRDLFLEKEVLSNGNIDRGEIIQKHCPVKFYKFILQNLEVCLFIAIVCVGTHNHPPPAPEKIPVDIKLSLQSLISQVIKDNDIITPRAIQSIAKAYKNMHPYGRDILGVFHTAKNNHSEIKDYLHHIEIYDLAKSILNAPSQELVKSILDKIKLSDKPGAKEWANYYKTPWIISSLNVHMSKMERNIWRKHDDNTNSAESAHALANKEENN